MGASRTWTDSGLGGALRRERHFGERDVLCFSERPPDLFAMFEGIVGRFGERPAIAGEERMTYRALYDHVASIASNLTHCGIARGDRVALFCGNRWEFLACVFACCRIGAIVVPVGIRQRQSELEFLLNDCSAKVLIQETELDEFLPPIATLPDLQHVFAIGDPTSRARPFSDLLSPLHPTAPALSKDDDTAVLLYTSGTTGRPKGAELTHLGILHSAMAFARSCGLTEQDRGLVAVPLSHVTGLVGVALATMIVGGCAVLMTKAYKTPEFLRLASDEKITYSILVPTIYSLIAMDPALASYDLSSWRIGCFGGAPMPVGSIERLQHELPHLELINAYGATETTSPATVMWREDWRDNIESVGKPLPYATMKAVDDDGIEVPAGTPGELLIAGPMVVPRYWQRPDANASEFVEGYWRSGDIGSIDAQGFVRVFDRKKDMINRGGFKIFCAEVENILSQLNDVLESALIGQSDPVLGERVHAIVVVPDRSSLSETDIQKFCRERLSDYKVPDRVLIRKAPLPRNANGKIQKALLRQNPLA